MAKLESPLPFTGSIGDLSAYRMRGVDKIVWRSKGGASRDKIRTHPNFDLTRRSNAEFGGRARATKFIMHALWSVKPLGDYNITGPLNSLLSRIQKRDETNAYGQRDITLSKNTALLEGFSLNRQMPFDSVVRNALICSLSRQDLSVQLEIPALVPGINLFTPKSHPYFSIMLTLDVMPDVVYAENGYVASFSEHHHTIQQITTTWYATRDGSPATTLQVALSSAPSDRAFSLLAAVGIQYGVPTEDEIVRIQRAGGAKVCVVG